MAGQGAEEQTYNCSGCGRPLKFIPQYGAYYCYYCQSYETPGVKAQNPCPTCAGEMTYIDVYNSWYCYTCQTYGTPSTMDMGVGVGLAAGAGGGGYEDTSVFVRPRDTLCPSCNRPMLGEQCPFCTAEKIIIEAEAKLKDIKGQGARVGRLEDELNRAKVLFGNEEYDRALEVATAVKTELVMTEKNFKAARKTMEEVEDILDKLAQFEVNISNADNTMNLAQNFMSKGSYDKAIEFLVQAKSLAEIDAKKAGYMFRPKKSRQVISHAIDACPECGNVLQGKPEKCPLCGTPITRAEEATGIEVVPMEAGAATAPTPSVAPPPPPPPPPPSPPPPAVEAPVPEPLMTEPAPPAPAPVPVPAPVYAPPPAPEPAPVYAPPPPSPPQTSAPAPAPAPVYAPPPAPAPTPEQPRAAWGPPVPTPAPVPAPAPVMAPPPPSPPPPPAPTEPRSLIRDGKCPTCGEEVEASWKRCPFCNSTLIEGFAPPSAPGPAPAPSTMLTTSVFGAPPAPPKPSPVIRPAPPKPSAPEPPKRPTCPSCSSPVEPGWKRCPVCMKPLDAPRPPAPTTTIVPPMPSAPGPPPPPPPPPPLPLSPMAPKPAAPPVPPIMQVLAPRPPPAPVVEKEEVADAGKTKADYDGLEKKLNEMEGKGVKVAHAKNIARLAQSFIKGGDFVKAQRYVRKAEKALEEAMK